MFIVDPETKKITIHQGDTDSVIYHFTGFEFGTNDRVLWTMRNEKKQIVKQHICTPEDDAVTVEFSNDDTDSLAIGTYKYDVRIVANPVYEDGKIVDGTFITTPGSPFFVEILPTVGQI